MSVFDNGAQWASGRRTSKVSVTHPTAALPHPKSRSGRADRPTTRRRLARLAITVAVLSTLFAAGTTATTRAATTYILMPRTELLRLPTTGSAWYNVRSEANASFGTPNLCDQSSKHPLRTFAAALVYARTGSSTYGSKARSAIMAAIKTQVVGCSNATLALGRSLMAYVLAADLARLSANTTADKTFRTWLSAIRTKVIGGHGTWTSLRGTHEKSRNNWGAHAGASRIAADIYLGDKTDLSKAALVTRGFLGSRSSYNGFTQQPDSNDLAWSCTGSASTFTPTNSICTRRGVNVDGAIAMDISRGGGLSWPPGDDGISYQLESIQGLGMQVELLYRNGYPDAWTWSTSAMKRAAGIVTRSAAAGGKGWNETQASAQMPWLLNKRYGTNIPTKINGIGRIIGFTSWLYG